MKIKLPFGLSENNILIHIADIERGVKYFCPGCRVPLLAVKGKIKQQHFRHSTGDECEHGLESAIHLFAKQKLREQKKITLPEYISTASATDSKGEVHIEYKTIAYEGNVICFDSVEEEKELQGIRADILARKGNHHLIIEIFYRHKVDEQKIEKIKKINISAIEINLSELMQEDVKDSDAYWSYMNDPKHIQWLHNVKALENHSQLESKLALKIQRLEKEYKEKEIIKKKMEHKEKAQLLQALDELKKICSKEHISRLNQDAEMNALWKSNSGYFKYALDELPSYLNIEVPNGDWIFGCDRRIWKTAFYNSFIRNKNSKYFSVKQVNDWLKNIALCKIPRCAEVVGMYARRYPDLVPHDISNNIPSSWATLRSYFNHLCTLGILVFSGSDSQHKGSFWFGVIGRTPEGAKNK